MWVPDGGAWSWLAAAGVVALCAGLGLVFAPWAGGYDARLRAGAPASAGTLWRAARHACRQPPCWRHDGWGALAAGALAAGLLAQQGWAGIVFLLPGLGMVALAWLDRRSGLLPDALTVPLMVAGWGLGPLGPVAAVGASAAIGGGLALTVWLYRWLRGHDGFGGGDVKCLAMLAGWWGVSAALMILWLASILGLLGWACCPGRRQQSYPFGPYLALAACPWLLWPDAAVRLGWL